ncbi:MAG: YiiX/YebB-like N1pC/P60 family cysteine hydrolase [Chthoniobacter sp.]
MSMFPRSKTAWLRSTAIFLVLIWACLYRNVPALAQLNSYEPQEGDVLFQSLPRGDLVVAIEGVTQSPWSHCGVVMQFDGKWMVVEAIGPVRRTPLALWIMRGRSGNFAAYRPTAEAKLPAPAKFHESMSTALDTYMGRPYDIHYAPGDREIYCSELVFKAYRDAFNLELGKWEPLGQLNWKPHETFIRTIEGGALPLDRPMITPVGLTRSPLLSRVYPPQGEEADRKKALPFK